MSLSRMDIINTFIEKYEYSWYLEIGCQNDLCFNKIKCLNKVGVDPEKGGTHRMTSDDFFKSNTQTFDIIFIDGLHEAVQVYHDIINALSILREGGTILCHDMNPQSELAQKVPREVKVWNGDCWKAFAYISKTNTDLEMFVIDADHGVGVIRKKPSHLITSINNSNDWINGMSYEEFNKKRKELLGLISVEEFKAKYL